MLVAGDLTVGPVNLFHVNHSCKHFASGKVLELLPIQVDLSAEHAAVYLEWRTAFPEGLSVFGYRHMTPDQPFGEVPRDKIDMEWECEQVRRRLFPTLPSRYQGFFTLASLEEAKRFREAMSAETGFDGEIWEVQAQCVRHRGDMRHLNPNR